MKKLLLSSLVIASVLTFAYTQTDIDDANYLATKGIITTQSTTAGYRLDDTITRAEVAGIALKLKGTTLPENYACKKYFSDVTKNDWICRAVEIAADARFVSRANSTFRPQDKITRAEALVILMKAGQLGIITQDMLDPFPWSDVKTNWQMMMLWRADIYGIVSFPSNSTNDVNINTWRPDNSATRAEVFKFAKNILEYQATMSGEIMIDSQNRSIEK